MELEKYDVEIINGSEFAVEFEAEIIDFLNKLGCNETTKMVEDHSEYETLIGAYMTEDGETFVFDYFFVGTEEKIRLKFRREENEKLYDFDIILTEAIPFVGCEKDSSLVLKP